MKHGERQVDVVPESVEYPICAPIAEAIVA